MKFKMKLAAVAMIAVGLSTSVAYADSITFTLANPNQSLVFTGGTENYLATVSAPAANGTAVFLNGDSFNVSAPVSLNDSPFFSNFPLSLAPGTSFTGNVFTLTLPPGSQLGTYTGTFTLLGGANGNASSALATVNYSLTAVTPEPSSLLLMITGVGAMTLLGIVRFARSPSKQT